MSRLVYCACTLLVITAAKADVGLGLSIKNDETTAYVPITAGRFMFEPYLRVSDDTNTAPNVSFTGVGDLTESAVRAIGVGIFRSVEPAEQVTFYYGARLAYTEAELIREPIPSDSRFGSRGSFEMDGQVIAPTLGFEYRFIERLSIGAEISVDHSEQEAVSVTYLGTRPLTLRTETNRNDTRADVIVRFFF
jgi:hypothetical protein